MPPSPTALHYHVWVRAFGGKGLTMLAAKLGAPEIRRQRERGARRLVKRWWRTRQAADKALRASGKHGFVRQCDMGHQCPEYAHVVSN